MSVDEHVVAGVDRSAHGERDRSADLRQHEARVNDVTVSGDVEFDRGVRVERPRPAVKGPATRLRAST